MDQNDQIWLDTLAWIGRGEVGWHLALVNARFAALVNKQLQQRQWCLEEFHISERKPKRTGAEVLSLANDGSYFALPLATSPLPDSVIGFNGTFNIWYLDAEVINFLQRFRRLFTTYISLKFTILMTEFRAWQAVAHHIWPLLKNGLGTLVNVKRKQLALMRKHISPTFLIDCPNLVEIISPVLPERPTVDNSAASETSSRDLYIWLHTTRVDRRPLVYKLLKWNNRWDQFVNELIMSFNTASVPVNYLVLTSFEFIYNRREQMVNMLTEERLTMLSNVHPKGGGGVVSFVKIVRCPAEFSEADMVSWLRMSRLNNEPHPNLVTIGFADDEIGPLPSDSAASMSRNISG
ncbi:hypothetical protein niasHS_016704 [Heterodera schachtii]|uniref:Uncharacterized protein n=1 Tax=Heterodera schachtii TaxID=97005 RepID=A0ABD2I0V3_HETSC